MNTKSNSTLKVLEKTLRRRNYAENTITAYVHYCRVFLLSFDRDAHHISAREAKKYLENYMYSSISQQNQIISAVKFLYRNVLGSKLRDLKIIRPRKNKTLPLIIDQQELISKIESISNLKHRAIIQLAFSTGMRVSEITNLKIKDIDSARMVVNVRQAKGNKDRIVKLSNGCLKLLREYYKEYKPTEYLFNGQSKPTYSHGSCRNIVKKYIGEGFKFHSLRHSSLTCMIENGTDVSIVQKMAGHSRLSTTAGYLHLTKNTIQNVYAPI
jgi:site-specific recombinase XerD